MADTGERTGNVPAGVARDAGGAEPLATRARRSRLLASAVVGLALVFGACSSDDEPVGNSSTGAGGAAGTGGAAAGAAGEAGASGAGAAGEAGAAGVVGTDYGAAGPAPVGHEVFELEDAERGRKLSVQVWYPAVEGARAASEAGVGLEELVAAGPDREALQGLLATAPERCTSRRTRSAAGAEPAAGTFPLVVFSHCHGCLKFSALTVAERLASHGIAVVATDHPGGTLFDSLAGKLEKISGTFLNVRALDVGFVATAMLDASNGGVPAPLRGRFDAARLGMMGHSYGAATTGKVLQEDARFRAGFAMAAPPASIGDVVMTKIDEPLFLLLAQEDNSIGSIGNNLIRDNYNAAKGRAWLAEVPDAGHWSFSDICALTDGFKPGCGEGKRQSDKSPFTYLDIEVGRAVASGYAAAFFDWALREQASAEDYLKGAHPSQVQVSSK